MTAETRSFPCRFVHHGKVPYFRVDIFMARQTQLARRPPQDKRVIRGMGRVTPLASSPDNRRVCLQVIIRLADIFMAGQAQLTIAVRMFEQALPDLGVVQLMAIDTVSFCKRPVQAESSPFISLPCVTAETKRLLRSNKQKQLGRLMGLMTGRTGLFLCRRMGPCP